jgi:hypothetical protein
MTDPNTCCRDPQMGWELATQAIQAVEDPSALLLDALAQTQAALGQFPAAVATEERALKHASTTAADTALADAIRARLELYKQGRSAADNP